MSLFLHKMEWGLFVQNDFLWSSLMNLFQYFFNMVKNTSSNMSVHFLS